MTRFKLFRLLLLIGAALFGGGQLALASIIVHGFTFDDNAFVDTVISTSVPVSYDGADLVSSVAGYDLFTSLQIPPDSANYVQLGFINNLVINRTGYDLVIFELARPESFSVSLAITSNRVFVQTVAGCCRSDGGAINVAKIELSDFGVPLGGTIDSIVLRAGVFGSGPDLAAVGALNSVVLVPMPEPGTLALLALGLAGLGYSRRKH